MSNPPIEESWDTMEDAGMVITDVGVLSKKEKAPQEYTVIENTHDGKKANFPEGRLGLTTRYICYTKKSASPQRGFVVVTDLKVLPLSDKSPLGFLPLLHTMDDRYIVSPAQGDGLSGDPLRTLQLARGDSSKSFHNKQLLARFVALEEATEAIADIIVLSGQKKEEVPSKYKRLPEINGFSICYKIGPIPKKNGKKSSQQQPHSNVAAETGGGFPIQSRGSHRIRKAIDGLDFKLAQEKDMVKDYRLGDGFIMMNLQDIENKYNVDFSKWKALVNQT